MSEDRSPNVGCSKFLANTVNIMIADRPPESVTEVRVRQNLADCDSIVLYA